VDLWQVVGARLNPYQYKPQRITEFEIRHFTHRHGHSYAIIRNPAENTYLRLGERDLFVWERLDGQNSTRDIAVAYVLEYGSVNFEGISKLIGHLHTNGFLQESRGHVYAGIQEWLQAQTIGFRFRRLIRAFFLKDFSIQNIDPFLSRLYRSLFWLCFTRPMAILLHLIVVAGLIAVTHLIFSGRYNALDLGQSPVLRILLLILLSQAAVFVHEVGHGITCKHYGRYVRRGGALIYLGRLAFFVDTTDIWMASRRPRIVVSWAGPLAHLVLGSLAALAVTFLNLGNETAHLLYQFALLAMLIGIVNLNPLLELDGYYMLMDYLEIPNLRKRALAFIGRPFWSKVRRRNRLTGEEWGFALFGALTGLYTGFVISASLFVWQRRLAQPLAGLLGDYARWLVWAMFLAIVVIAFWPRLKALAGQSARRPAARRR
jgi:putative peptide zinc metalloprotease protein